MAPDLLEAITGLHARLELDAIMKSGVPWGCSVDGTHAVVGGTGLGSDAMHGGYDPQ